MVLCPWSLVLGPLSLVLGPWFRVLGPLSLVRCGWFVVVGRCAWSLVRSQLPTRSLGRSFGLPPKSASLETLARPWAATKLEVLCGLRSSKASTLRSRRWLRALRVEGLIVIEYTEPLPGNDMLIRTFGDKPSSCNMIQALRPWPNWALTT